MSSRPFWHQLPFGSWRTLSASSPPPGVCDDQYLNGSMHIFCCALWNSCITVDFSSLICRSVSYQYTRSLSPLDTPWFRICSNLKPLSSKGHMPCLSFGVALDCLPVSTFWGALWGLLCLICATWDTMAPQRRIPALWSLLDAGSTLPLPAGRVNAFWEIQPIS